MKLKQFLFLTSYFYLIHVSAQEKLRVEYDVIPYYEAIEKNAFEVTVVPSLFELISNKDESFYNHIPTINNEQTEISSRVSASMSVDANPVYKNTDSKIYVEEAQIAEKKFLIKDGLPQIDWKITKETKEIAGFPVLKATAILTDQYTTEVEAWYSPKLNYKTGPDKFWGLPGIILEVKTQINYDDGSKEGTRYVATKVSTLTSNEKFKIPNKGKEISQKEFTELINKFMAEQMEMYNGGVDKD